MGIERDKFVARLSEARDGGLVDQKYFFDPDHPMKPEEICAAINQVEDAAKTGARHTGWKGNDPA